MSDLEEDECQMFGTLLEPYDEDTVPKKKAFTIEDQVATDAQGRRRFHGAFTGGFSAGFFNTVGSLEGWKPSEFKSSRTEKAEKRLQKPQDFMDEEDVGEFGIAPTTIKATNDYTSHETKTNRKRTFNDGPIPGVPVLHSLLQPAKETFGIKLLKQMGWKPGQGVGPRLTKSEKKKRKREHKQTIGKVYGCEIPVEFRTQISNSESSSDEDETDITFAPDDYDPFVYKPKDNTFGMGYTGLDKRTILSSHISLFDPPSEFRMCDLNNKKISISGQAFGVGAFENEDQDIYMRDDMSKYDFELDSHRAKKEKKIKSALKSLEVNILDGFQPGLNSVPTKSFFPSPVLPKNFIPKHGVRISRFEPLPETHKYYNFDRKKKQGRHDLSATDRAKIINASNAIITTPKEIIKINSESESKVLKEKITEITRSLPSTYSGQFKPFITNPEKQNRYEQFLDLLKRGESNKLIDIQPISMTDFEKDHELNEFKQAARLYKPVTGLIFDRFVTASNSDDLINPLKPVDKSVYLHGNKEMREAVKLKKFGHLTRMIDVWKPNKLLCKRFNVPEPEISLNDLQQSQRKRGKYSVFDYYEAYQQNKEVKEGPVQKPEVIEVNLATELSSVESVTTITTTIDEDLITKQILQSETKEIISNLEENEASTSFKNIVTEENKMETKLVEPEIKIVEKEEEKKLVTKQKSPQIPIPTDPKEKMDLFKAIFLSSSSESENEDENEKETTPINKTKREEERMDEMKKIVLETETKPSKGIFANLDWSQVNKTKSETNRNEHSINKNKNQNEGIHDKKSNDDSSYGPSLPTERMLWKQSDMKQSDDSDVDEWMEGDNFNKMEKKHKRKHKKHKNEKKKDKHSKHKSKHKKKKH